jgi:hypothetical protein
LASASAFTPFIVNKSGSPGPAPTKVTMGFTILCISDIFCSVRFYVLKNAIASSIYFLESLRRFVLIDLVDQFKGRIQSDFIVSTKTTSNKLMIPAWWFVFRFQLINSFSAIYKTGIR